MEIKKYSEIASLLASLVAGVAGLAFLISMVFDIGYFKEIGYPMTELPTTLSDHVRSSMNWMSWILSGIMVSLFMELLTKRIEKGKTEEEIVNSSRNPRLTQIIRNSPHYFIVGMSIVFVVLYKVYGGPFKIGLPLSLFFVWGNFAYWSQTTDRILERRSKALRMAIIIIPAVGLLTYTAAQLVADFDILRNDQMSKIYFINGEVRGVKVLRALDRGFLVHQPKSPNIEFISLGLVAKIERLHADIDLIKMNGLFSEESDETAISNTTSPAPDK